MHGGLTPKTNQNAAKPGSIYSKFLTPEEQAQFDALELGNVDSELRLCKIRLARALSLEQQNGEKLELDFAIKRTGRNGGIAQQEVHTKRRDYQTIIDRLMARIESLERTRKSLDGGDGDNDDIVGFEVVPYEPNS
jgi:hypothetical protein